MNDTMNDGKPKNPFDLAAEALSGAAGFAQGLEREGRVQAKDMSRRLSLRLGLTDGEEFAALREEVQRLEARLAALEARTAGGAGGGKRAKAGAKAGPRAPGAARKTKRKAAAKKAAKKAPRKKTIKKAASKKSAPKRG